MSRWFSSFRVKPSVECCAGQHLVGCTDFMCGPQTNAGTIGHEGDLEEEQWKCPGTFLRLYYPAQLSENGKDSENVFWMPKRRYVDGLISFMKLPTWLFGGVFHWLIGSVQIPAQWNVPVLGQEKEELFPCLVFSHGLGGNRYIYSSFCCELASQGFVVAAVEHRDESASATFVLHENQGHNGLLQEWIPFHVLDKNDNEFELRNNQLHKRVTECKQAMDILEKIQQGSCPRSLMQDTIDLSKLKGRLDLNKTAIMGHSFGAATAVHSLAKDRRFRCGVCLDIWMFPIGKEFYLYENKQPILFINSEQFHKWRSNVEPLKQLLGKNNENLTLIAIRGTGHMSQCDVPCVLPDVLLSMINMNDSLDPETAIRLNKKAIWAFLQRHLEIGSPTKHEPIIDGGDKLPEHFIFGSFSDP